MSTLSHKLTFFFFQNVYLVAEVDDVDGAGSLSGVLVHQHHSRIQIAPSIPTEPYEKILARHKEVGRQLAHVCLDLTNFSKSHGVYVKIHGRHLIVCVQHKGSTLQALWTR